MEMKLDIVKPRYSEHMFASHFTLHYIIEVLL